MAEFKISRIRYTWKGDWNTSTSYQRDDVVAYGGSSWVCIRKHDSSTFNADQSFFANINDTDPSPAWEKMTDGFQYRGDWAESTLYNLGDIVLYGGTLYVNVISYTSTSNFEENSLNWEIYSTNINWLADWQPETSYGIGDLVRYGGNVYKCILGHQSDTTANGIEVGDGDSTNDSTLETWKLYYGGIDFKGAYSTQSIRYKKDDLVLYNGTLLRCIEGYTSSMQFDDTKWSIELPGSKFNLEWDASTYYGIGSVVRNGGYLFYAVTANYNQRPVDSIYSSETIETVYWQILSKGINFRGDWSAENTYKTGDVVRRGGNLYVALLDTTDDGSSLDYLDDSNWEIVVQSQNWRSFWESDTAYSINDLVVYLGNTYQCNEEHESSNENYPGDNGNGFYYWDLVLQSGSPAGLNQRGDLLTYNLSRTQTSDFSTFGPTNVSLGNFGQLLTINDEDTVIYKNYAEITRIFYVSTSEGIDDISDSSRGISPFMPWKTVRFACEQADDNFSGTTIINVDAGDYEEILPIIVPARTAILGSELRSTTIKPKGPIAELANDSTYTVAVLQRFRNIIRELITGQQVSPTDGNTSSQIFPDDPSLVVEGDTINQTRPRQPSLSAGNAADQLLADIQDYINFYINSQGSAPTLVGTNTASTDIGYIDGAAVLLANKEFLASEAVAFMIDRYSEYAFDSELCKRDVRRYVDAIVYDLIYTGNYKSILAGRYYRNAVLGSSTEDMFYLRDATGVRNCTLSGLTGSLNPPNVFDLFRRPTGGSFTSLDPGWGPADNRTWILTRSPYIQGVTTIGTGCIGQKIDGALHNGGNKSFVSNDFTQVISDGVGAWVLNNGRAELVSVFTYYCQVGYLAEDGGVIRATNGNCSYGTFGAIAEGVDEDEIPATGAVNTRAQEAIVASAFSGDFVDKIQILEWTNAGQNYTQATADIVGSGVNAEVVFDDFRDNAVFNARLLDTSDNPAITQVGGSGYSIAQNNAQVHGTPGGDATSITIATNDNNEEADYLGKRIIITSGAGTGQYGYITAYNTSTKVVSVARESDDTPGWDHVVPGTPIQIPLDTSTVYRIEPRVTFSDPGFTVTDLTAPVSADWACSTFGETTESFTNIPGEAGSGVVIEDDGLTAITATFDIVKVGRSYEVTLNNDGAGYAVGDEITIPGNSLGGATPENDLVITVTQTTDDSTNSITSFTTEGTGVSGKFIIITQGGSAGLSSRDGDTWESFNMPSSGDWLDVVSGDNRFVAIKNASDRVAYSLDGENWTQRNIGASRNWTSIAYGNDVFVAVAQDQDSGAFSSNGGVSWTSTTLPDIGDSTSNEWIDIAYGKNLFVALANSNNVVASGVYDSVGNSIDWTGHIMDVIDDSAQKDWISITYGADKFVAISTQGDISYSFDSVTWYSGGSMPSQDGSTAHFWRDIKYGQGIFFAVGDTGARLIGDDPSFSPSSFCATSQDGINWTPRELTDSLDWRSITFGNPYIQLEDSSVGLGSPMWIASASNSPKINKIRTGAKALGRVTVSAGVIGEVRIWNPGSGYVEPPSITIFDPNTTTDASVECRIADGVLSDPSWINRGLGFRSASTRVTIEGDGFADVIPVGKFVTVTNLNRYPGPGTQLLFAGNETIYTVVTITELGGENGNLSAQFRISPELKAKDNVEHDTAIGLRERYAQCRITGHDFLDIGTGNFEQTNYPELYTDYLFVNAPENEVLENEGGRVFYTSTDQSGNFRTGELFAVEQSTGIVTISSDFFDLNGLSELRLGGVRLGGSGVVIREFSTDPTFTEDSNNVIPTQRAIAAYLQSRLSVGGSEIATASFIAGTVRVGPDLIGNTAGLRNLVPVKAVFEGSNAGIRGSILAQTMFYRSFGDN